MSNKGGIIFQSTGAMNGGAGIAEAAGSYRWGSGEDDGRIFKGIYVVCVIAKQTNKQK